MSDCDIDEEEIRVVVAIDFGTTCSGFAYAHVVDPEIIVNDKWPGPKNSKETADKVSTVLQYDKDLKVTAWGAQVSTEEPGRVPRRPISELDEEPETIVEYFKLHLASHISPEKKHYLPKNLPYHQAIKDFLEKMLPEIKKCINLTWPSVKLSQVKFVFSVPAEWRPETIGIFKEYIYRAGYLTKDKANLEFTTERENLEFTTEPEAAALFCVEKPDYGLKEGDTILICDCGGGTVDLTMRTLLPEKKFREVTPRTGGFCGSTYVDANFISFLGRKVGVTAIEKFKKKHYSEYRYLIQRFFCPRVKFGFTGIQNDYKDPIILDIERTCRKLKKCVTGDLEKTLEDDDWLIEIGYDDILKMFDPVVEDIIELIKGQLEQLTDSPNNCSHIFLVGGFAGSEYLVDRLKKKFLCEGSTTSDDNLKVPQFCVPPRPIVSVVRGGVMYGLKKDAIKTRMLTHYFGIRIYPKWKKNDPRKRRTLDGRIYKFDCLAERGQEVGLDEPCSRTYYPIQPDQDVIIFKVCYTLKQDVIYYDDSELKPLGDLEIKLPDTHLGRDRPVIFSLMFGELDVTATAYNEANSVMYTVTFKYPKSSVFDEPTDTVEF